MLGRLSDREDPYRRNQLLTPRTRRSVCNFSSGYNTERERIRFQSSQPRASTIGKSIETTLVTKEQRESGPISYESLITPVVYPTMKLLSLESARNDRRYAPISKLSIFFSGIGFFRHKVEIARWNNGRSTDRKLESYK